MYVCVCVHDLLDGDLMCSVRPYLFTEAEMIIKSTLFLFASLSA